MQQATRAAILSLVLTVSRYLLREFLLASSAVLAALMATMLAADTLLHLDEFGESSSAAFAGVVERLLRALPIGVPMACVVGVVWSVTRAVRSREITAIRCGGIPLQRALFPIVAASVLIAFGLGYFEDRVTIKARQVRSEGVADEDRPRPVKKNGFYWYASGPSVFVARSYDKDAGTLREVTYFRYDDQREIRQRIDAASAVHVKGYVWEFRDATVSDFGVDGITHEPARSIQVGLGLSGRDMARAERALDAETLHGLAERMQEAVGEELIALEARFHSRLAQPFAVIVLVLLALPFAAGDTERGDSFARSLLLAIAGAAAFWLAWSMALLAAQTGTVPPALPVWTVPLAFLAVATWRFRQVQE